MKGTKLCWNPMCFNWCNDPNISNCVTEDIETQECRLSGIDLRPVINNYNISMAIKNTEPEKSIDPTVPNRMGIYYMHSNHSFTKLKGQTLEKIIEHLTEIRKTSYYGMLCPIILSRDDKEIRRIGPPVHCCGSDQNNRWESGVADWVRIVKADEDVMRLLPKNEMRR